MDSSERRALRHRFTVRLGAGDLDVELLAKAWPSALIALHSANGFSDRFTKTVAAAKLLIAGLESNSRFKVTKIPSGTNIFRLDVPGSRPETFRANLMKRGVELLALG